MKSASACRPAVSARRLSADDYAAARTLAGWRKNVLAAWPGVRVAYVESAVDGTTPQLGGHLTLRAEVDLNGLTPDDVDVEAVFGPVDDEDRLHDVRTQSLNVAVPEDGVQRYEGELALGRTGAFGYTVRVLPKNALLAQPAELGVVATA